MNQPQQPYTTGPGPVGFYPPPFPPAPAPPRKRHIWPMVFVGALLAVGVAVSIGSQHAGSGGPTVQDKAFLTAVRGSVPEFSARTDSDVISLGHKTCAALDAGNGFVPVAFALMDSGSMTAYDAGYFVGASIGAYCPADVALVPAG